MAASGTAGAYDHLLKLLLIGDSGVGKSSLLLRFTEDKYDEQQLSTIGVDFRVRFLAAAGLQLKLAIWDTAGQERFRTLAASYYRGAQGVILVYDVSSRSSFESCCSWLREVERHGTVPGCVKMMVANKIDKEREVSTLEGQQLAATLGCLFVETSAKTSANVFLAFQELVEQILASPSLLVNTRPISSAGKFAIEEKQKNTPTHSSCSC